ncbi:MAG: hypothetical protein GEU88_06020 [Solirubrobacterales bacterium]|nr:hypothetical protein [Solirubrobacterales bacterium]
MGVLVLLGGLIALAGGALAIHKEEIADLATVERLPPPCEGVQCSSPLLDDRPGDHHHGPAPGFVPTLPRLITWASGVDVNFLNGVNDGGIYISREDGTQQRQLTEFANFNRELDDHGLNLPDDHPSFSPDNRRIIFASNRDDKNNWEIWIMNVNGSGQEKLTDSPGLDTEPVISPDGSQVAWVSERFGGLDVVRAPLDDLSDPIQVTTSSAQEIEPAWRPDGQRLAFSRLLAPEEKDVFTVNVDGSDEHRVTSTPGEDHDATYSPGGDQLLITSQRAPFSSPFGNIYRIDAETGAPIIENDLIAPLDGDLTGDLANGAVDPFISRDGSKIAFFKSVFPVLGPTALFVMDANGFSKRHIPGHGSVNVHPAIGRAVDTDRDGTLDYLESGTVGTAGLRPRAVPAGHARKLRFSWRHPRAWSRLDTIYLRVARRRTVASLQYSVRDRSLSLQDPSTGYWGLGRRLGGGRLEAGPLRVDLRRSRLVKRSKRTMVLVVAARFASGVCAPRPYRVVVKALDRDASSQEEKLGKLRIRCRAGA